MMNSRDDSERSSERSQSEADVCSEESSVGFMWLESALSFDFFTKEARDALGEVVEREQYELAAVRNAALIELGKRERGASGNPHTIFKKPRQDDKEPV